MPQFGQQSYSKLATCEQELQTLLLEVVKTYDVSIVFGNRSMAIQNALYLKGRKKIPASAGDRRSNYLIEDIKKVVTYRGFEKKSMHNYNPSRAVDVIPYPSGWSNVNKIYEMAGFIKATYLRLKKEGKLKKDLRFGSDWLNPADPAHIEMV